MTLCCSIVSISHLDMNASLLKLCTKGWFLGKKNVKYCELDLPINLLFEDEVQEFFAG